MIRDFVDPIDNHKPDANVCKVFDQIAQSVPRAMAHVSQVAARTKNRHKRKQGQQGHEGPDDFVSFQAFDEF